MITELIVFLLIILVAFYFFLEWNAKRQLKKLRRDYEQTKQNSGTETIRSVIGGEQNFERRIKQDEVRRTIEQPEIVQPRTSIPIPSSSGRTAISKGTTGKSKDGNKPVNRFPKLQRI